MTLQAPLHLQRRSLRHHRHLIDAAVARRAADAFIHVNRVIEISKVGQVVNSNPLERLSAFETRTHRLEIRAVGPNLFVTIHADRRRGHACRGGRLDGSVTIAAINAVITGMMFVTELNWLLALDVRARVPSRAIDFVRDKQCRYQKKERPVDRGPRQIVCAVTENLWHRRRIIGSVYTADLSAIIASRRNKSRLSNANTRTANCKA